METIATSRAAKREQFVQRIGQKLRPEELSDFNVDRWLDSYDGNIDACSKVVDEYVKNRRALGLDMDEMFQDFYARPDIRHYCECFPQSMLDVDWVNPADNGLIFVEMGPKEPAKLARLIRAGQFLHCFFAWCEHMLRLILARERVTGRRSYAVCIFDMQHVSILQYANPLGPINRIFEMRVHLAMAYYAEMLSQVVIVNPPRMLAILFKIMSFLLPQKIIGRFHIAQSAADASKWIPLEAIPTGLGGTKEMPAALLPNGCIPPREFGKDDFLMDGMIWQHYSEVPVYEHLLVRSGQTFVRILEPISAVDEEGQEHILLYEIFASRTFELLLMDEESGDFLLPHLQMCTPQLAEEGAIPLMRNGGQRIRLEVRNTSKFFGLKLRMAIKIITRKTHQ